MEENEVQVEEVSEVAEQEVTDAFDSAWDDDPVIPDDDEQTADEPDASEEEAGEEAEAPESETPQQGKEAEEGNQLFTINYLGNEEKLTLEEMTELAQKGRNYDHVKGELDQLKADGASKEQLAFLKELADRAGLTVEEQIDRTRALWLQVEESDKGNDISEAEAIQRVQRKRNAPKEETPEKTEDAQTKVNMQVDRFLKVYPKVQAGDIPQEVWNRAKELDGNLLEAYQEFEIKRLKEDAAKTQQTEKNRQRSTGSRQTAGSGKTRDPFDEGWDS